MKTSASDSLYFRNMMELELSQLRSLRSEPSTNITDQRCIIGHDATILECLRAMMLHSAKEAIIIDSQRTVGYLHIDDIVQEISEAAQHFNTKAASKEASELRRIRLARHLIDELRRKVTRLFLHESENLASEKLDVEKLQTEANSLLAMIERFENNIIDTRDSLDWDEATELNSFILGVVAAVQTTATTQGSSITVVSSDILETRLNRRLFGQSMRAVLDDLLLSNPKGSLIEIETNKQITDQGVWGHITIRVIPNESQTVSVTSLDEEKHAVILSGLAHALLVEAVKAHNGHVTFDTSKETTNQFKIQLKCVDQSHQRNQETMPKILVAEDDADVLEMLVEIIKSRGYKVVAAKNGVEALDKFYAEKPSLVLSDVRMPGLDGCELSALIKQQDPTIPVILFSGQYPHLMQDRLANKITADHVFFKPFTARDVLESLHLFIAPN